MQIDPLTGEILHPIPSQFSVNDTPTSTSNSQIKNQPFVRSPYNYNMSLVSDETGLKCEDPSLAQQHSKDECDINIIMERFGRGQALPEGFRAPQFADFSGIGDYHTAMNRVAEANEAFDAMPAQLRARFNNDPAELMAFLDNGENRSEAIKLGLVPPPPPAPENPPQAALDPLATVSQATKPPAVPAKAKEL